jgi:ATP-dependent DNA helicase DinG
LDAAGLVVEVRVCARGHEGAVPAFIEQIQPREVVLHNHPSGVIAPSEADLQLSAIFAKHAHGVYIVDNAIERVYVVVEPFLESDVTFLETRELDEAFSEEGRLARVLPEYEARPQQVEMMDAVADAFNKEGVAVVEAPTGVGKTLAYLLPAVLWAVRNRERVVISTNTINLQEQICGKDVPTLRKAIDERFSCVLVKGRGNYLCHRKLRKALSEATLFDEEGDKNALKKIAEWAEHTEDGSRADLPFMPGRELWDRVCSEADTCSFRNCPAPGTCFVGKARRELAKADVIVANHHMLFSDLAVKKEIGKFNSIGVLPAFERVIFDEAHNIENAATEYFGLEVTRIGAFSLLGRFVSSERRRERGLIPFLKAKLMREVKAEPALLDPVLDLLDNELLPAIAAAREALTVGFDAVRSWVVEQNADAGKSIRYRLTADVLNDRALREIHSVYMLPASEEIRTCAVACTKVLGRMKALAPLDPEEESPVLTEQLQLDAYRNRLIRLANGLAIGTSSDLPENTVRWIEIDSGNNRIVRMASCPLDVGEPMAEWVYSNLKTVVMTSATLTANRKFDYLAGRIGLDRVKAPPPHMAMLESPFDFQEQALLCIPDDVPPPDDGAFPAESVACMEEALAISGGHAFILFTSFYALDHAFNQLAPGLRKAGITPLKQGADTRTQLLEQFRNDSESVLFATDSFWEGVDVAGDALQMVLIPRLPFRVPTEPVLQARSEAIDAAGGNAFMEYTVPQAVLKFRQGFGRLIRRKSDRGAIVVLDSRVVSRRYGRVFLNSLPGVRIVQGPRRGTFMALRQFFDADKG